MPESLTKAVDRTSAGVDFFVCLVYLTPALGLSAAATLVTAPADARVLLVVTAVAALGVAPLLYRAAVTATDAWSAAVRAVVDVGRVPLAEALGLVLPDRLADERTMWQTVGWLVTFHYDPRAATALDPYRKQTKPAEPARRCWPRRAG